MSIEAESDEAHSTRRERMSDLVERLRNSTEQMAHRASVDFMLWNEHSNACLEAASTITALEERVRVLEANLAEAYERAAKECWNLAIKKPRDNLDEAFDLALCNAAENIRKLKVTGPDAPDPAPSPSQGEHQP